YMHPEARVLAEEIKKLQISRKHRALHPATEAHRKFLKDQYVKTLTLAEKYAFLDLKEELMYFSGDGE
ncbi:MAG TPA: GSCFA domain-containing protein, partial [Puia sp.]